MMKKNNLYKAFTLIELLIVMAIIAVLATVLVIIINPAEYNRRTNDTKRLSDMQMIKSAIDLAGADSNTLPDTGGVYKPITSSVPVTDIDGNGFDIHKYLSTIPDDPSHSASGIKGLVFDSGSCVLGTISGPLEYQLEGNGTEYHLRSFMQSTVNCDKVIEDSGNAYYQLTKIP